MRSSTLFLVPTVIVSGVLGNFALAWGMKHAAPGAGPILSLLHPAVIAGIVLLIVWTLLRMKLLSFADLTYVLPVTSVGYVLNALLGAAFLSETISPARWAGTILIMAGAALTGGAEQDSPQKGAGEP